jgi:hypothetical protein
MTHLELAKELNLSFPFVSITRKKLSDRELGALPEFPVKSGCTMRALKEVFNGTGLVLTEERCSCRGARNGFGFHDGITNMPGGFELFLTCGAGEGYPPGERLKASPEVVRDMISGQPQGVLAPYNALEFKPFEGEDKPDLVTALVNPDQLSVFATLYSYRTGAFDRVIMPMTSGCGSIFRIPMGEARTGTPRAVIGNSDINSRFFFDPPTFFFTVTGERFREMLADAPESFIFAPVFKGVQKRL